MIIRRFAPLTYLTSPQVNLAFEQQNIDVDIAVVMWLETHP